MADHSVEEEDIYILCSIFPKEVWQKVLQNVYHSDDYTRIANSSAIFKNLGLVPHWNCTVLPKILELFGNCFGYHTPSGGETILNLRLVSRGWKEVVDNFLENLPEHFMLSQELCLAVEQSRNDPRPKPCSVNQTFLHTIHDVAAFREKFDTSHLPHQRNPFVSRELRISLSLDLVNVVDYGMAIRNLLRDYGRHVWYFWLEVSAWDPQVNLARFGVGEWIRDMISLLPCLRTLQFMVLSNFNRLTETPGWQQRFSQMEQFWTQNQMPNLPHLTKVGEHGIPWPIVLALLRANPQVTVLESWSLLISNNARSVLENQVPKNLEKLCIFVKDIDQLQILASAQIDWPLKMLSIDPKDTTVPWENLIAVIESKFGQTLRQLYAPVVGVPVDPLNLPNLEVLHLNNLNSIPQFDFVLPVASTLKTLYVEFIWSMGNENDLQNRLSQIPRQSDLWQVMPRLQKFSVMLQPAFFLFCWYNCSRRQWETRQQNQNHAE